MPATELVPSLLENMVQITCPACEGFGAASEHLQICPRCHGSGENHRFHRVDGNGQHKPALAASADVRRSRDKFAHLGDETKDFDFPDVSSYDNTPAPESPHDGSSHVSVGSQEWSSMSMLRSTHLCPVCQGFGKIKREHAPSCSTCNGQRSVSVTAKAQTVRFPAGVSTGYSQKLTGMAGQKPWHTPGDIVFQFTVRL